MFKSNSSIWKHTTLCDKGVFLFHHSLATSTTIELKLYFHRFVSFACWDSPGEKTGLSQYYQRYTVPLSLCDNLLLHCILCILGDLWLFHNAFVKTQKYIYWDKGPFNTWVIINLSFMTWFSWKRWRLFVYTKESGNIKGVPPIRNLLKSTTILRRLFVNGIDPHGRQHRS